MVNSPKSEVIEGGGKLARALNDKGVEVTFGKRSEGNDDLSTVIDMAANQINSSSGSSVEIGTFTDLQTLINDTNESIIILDKNYQYNNTTDSNLTNGISINKNITIIGNGHIIDGNNSKRAFYISGQYTVNLSDVRIQNCNNNNTGGAIDVTDAIVNITNIQFVNNTVIETYYSYGGAINIYSGTVNINNTIFSNNTGIGEYYSFGGAINITAGTVNINNTLFNQNNASVGGAINTDVDANLTVTNCTFNQNNANSDGGAVYVMDTLSMIDCIFKENTATNSYANIYSYNEITVYNCIIPNIATTCYNITNVSYQRELISGTNIKTINNESILGNGNLEVGTNIGTFSDLQELISDADDGNTIILDKDYKFDSSTDSNITTGIPISKNITLIGNGHIIDGNNNVRIFKLDADNLTFNLYNMILQNGNASDANGGAIFLMHGTVNVFNVIFNNNTAYMGGAIAVASSSPTVLNMMGCSFKNNTATYYADVQCIVQTTVYNCIISDISTSCYKVSNITTELLSTSKQDTLVSGTNIKTVNNESLLGSGNITIQGGTDIVTSWEQVLSDTKVPSEKLTKDTIDTKISKSQTAGLVKNDGTVNTSLNKLNSIIDELRTLGLDLFDYDEDYALFVYLFFDRLQYNTDNEKVYYTKNGSTYYELATINDIPNLTNYIQKSNTTGLIKNDGTITDIKTINNESLLGSGNIIIQGGGIEIGTFTDLQTLINNATAPSGQIPIIILDKDYKYDSTTDSSLTDGISISKNITLIGNGHVIDGNNSKRAFYINGQYTFNLSDVRIQNCNESYGGGAIYANSATININNTQFTNNTTTGTYGYGGAIYARNGASVNINNTIFNKNSATEYSGGAIHINGTLSMINCSFKDNTANNYANIYSNNVVTVYDCIISNIATSCYNVSNITTESLYDAIEGLEEDMLL